MYSMVRKGEVGMAVRVEIGFAAGDGSEGVAYALVRGHELGSESVVRVPFSCRRLPALDGRDVAYAAVLAVCEELHRRGVRRIALDVDAESLVHDLRDHRPVPAALSMPYVLLGCSLNRFADARLRISHGPVCRDLTARARAEVALHVAA